MHDHGAIQALLHRGMPGGRRVQVGDVENRGFALAVGVPDVVALLAKAQRGIGVVADHGAVGHLGIELDHAVGMDTHPPVGNVVAQVDDDAVAHVGPDHNRLADVGVGKDGVLVGPKRIHQALQDPVPPAVERNHGLEGGQLVAHLACTSGAHPVGSHSGRAHGGGEHHHGGAQHGHGQQCRSDATTRAHRKFNLGQRLRHAHDNHGDRDGNGKGHQGTDKSLTNRESGAEGKGQRRRASSHERHRGGVDIASPPHDPPGHHRQHHGQHNSRPGARNHGGHVGDATGAGATGVQDHGISQTQPQACRPCGGDRSQCGDGGGGHPSP